MDSVQTEKILKINEEITRLEEQYLNVVGTTTEVYSRVVGYYRSVHNWNVGKRKEFDNRQVFDLPTQETLQQRIAV